MNNKIKDFLLNNVVLFGLVIIVILFSMTGKNFFTMAGFKSILRQIVEIGYVAAPMTLLMITGSVDLSIGSIIGMAGVIATHIMNHYGIVPGIFGGLIIGFIAGMINGVFVSYLKLHPIVITLGTLLVWYGFTIALLQGRTLYPPDTFEKVFKTELLGMRVEVYVLALIFLLCWWLLHRNRFGRYLYAIGGNERTAFLMGIKVKRIRLFMHGIVGLFSGLVGLLYVSKFNGALPSHGAGIEFPVLTVVLLGGVAFSGGYGKVVSVIFSLFFVGVLKAGLVIVGISEFIQQMVVGATLIGAVTLNTILFEFRKQMVLQGPDAMKSGGKDEREQ